MIETPTSKNIRKVIPLILVILAALFFLNSCKNNRKEVVFNPNPTAAKINFKNESSSIDFSAQHSRIELRLNEKNNHSYNHNQFVINV